MIKEEARDRLSQAVSLALRQGDGMLDIRQRGDEQLRHLSTKLMDTESGIAYPEVSPATFSFNSPKGAAPPAED